MSELMSIEYLIREFDMPQPVAEKLMSDEGISQTDLDSLLAQIYGITHENQIKVTRMNTIGQLRAFGYSVQGGRQGRSLPYRILGYEAKKERRTIHEWGGEPWDWVQSLTPLTPHDRPWVEESLRRARNDSGSHESSWGYIWCYEMARDIGYKFEDRRTGNRAIFIQKHRNFPRFRIFNFSLTPEQLCLFGAELSRISLQSVRVLFLADDDLKSLRGLAPGGWKSHRRQAIYQVDRILDHTRDIVGKRMVEAFRQCERQVDWRRVFPYSKEMGDYQGIRKTIDTWRDLNEKKHRQLAVTRDYQFLDTVNETKDDDSLCFLGYRNGFPCTTHLLDPIVTRDGVWGYAQIVEKSLNYSKFENGSPVPGGKYGTADFNVWKTCAWLRENMPHITHINAGGYDGGGMGLPEHKAIYALEGDDVYSNTFDFPYKHVEESEIEI